MEDTSSDVSYLYPRDSCMYLENRLFEGKKTNLLSLFGDETEEHSVSKSEKVKVYLRIKPKKNDTTQMLGPPQASEIFVLCVCVIVYFNHRYFQILLIFIFCKICFVLYLKRNEPYHLC
jgi:hypothetical protein